MRAARRSSKARRGERQYRHGSFSSSSSSSLLREHLGLEGLEPPESVFVHAVTAHAEGNKVAPKLHHLTISGEVVRASHGSKRCVWGSQYYFASQ